MPTANLAEAQNHPIDAEAFLKHHRDIQSAQREKNEAGTALAREKKAAKSGGIDLKAYKWIEQLRDLETEEQAILLRHLIDYATILQMPIGTQFSLMDAPQAPPPAKPLRGAAKLKAEAAQAQLEAAAREEAAERGLRAGRDGAEAESNPYKLGSETYVAWSKGHADGLQEAVTAEFMGSTEGERPADVADATRKAGQGRGRGRSAKVAESMENARLHLNGGGHAAH